MGAAPWSVEHLWGWGVEAHRHAERPSGYRPTPPAAGHQAVAELWNCAGSQFDPAVVDTLANLVLKLAWPPERSTAGTRELVPDHS
jgi:hypothetical protein